MEVYEPVGIMALISEINKTKCDHNLDKKNWKLVLEGKTTGHLTENIPRDRGLPEPTWPPPNGVSSVKQCSSSMYPAQAHHLIPWKTLIKHSVLIHLDHKKSRVYADNNYSVNHGNNGKFMPFATPLIEWVKATGEAEKTKVANALMDCVGIQLHQGPHSARTYDDNFVNQAYKVQVQMYLDKISDHALKHTNFCDECKAKKDADKWPPRENIVGFLDKASSLLEKDIGAGFIFVSRRAHAWFMAKVA